MENFYLLRFYAGKQIIIKCLFAFNLHKILITGIAYLFANAFHLPNLPNLAKFQLTSIERPHATDDIQHPTSHYCIVHQKNLFTIRPLCDQTKAVSTGTSPVNGALQSTMFAFASLAMFTLAKEFFSMS